VRDLKGNHADMRVSRAACGALFSEAEVLEAIWRCRFGLSQSVKASSPVYTRRSSSSSVETQISAGLSAVRAVVLHKRAVGLHSRAVARHVPPPLAEFGDRVRGLLDLLVISPRLSPGVVLWVFPGEADF
jgi:hypothetical protein